MAFASSPASDTSARALNAQAQALFGAAPAQALRAARRAEQLAQAAGDSVALTDALRNQGSAHYLLAQYEPALKAYLKALALSEQLGDFRRQSACLNNLGNLSFARGNHRVAISFYGRSLSLDRRRGDSLGVAGSYLNLANVLLTLKQQPRALKYYKQAYALYRAGNDSINATNALSNVGWLYVAQGRYAAALPYLKAGLEGNRANGDVSGEAVNLQNLGDVYRGLRQWGRAVDYYRQSSRVGRAYGAIVRDNYARLAEVQQAEGHPAEALASYRRYVTLKDSILSREAGQQMAVLETRYRTREQGRQLQVQRLTLRAQREAITRKNQQTVGALILATLLLVGAVGLTYQVRRKNEANRRLATANAEVREAVRQKEALIQEIHHRVKNNLQMVNSLLKLQATADPELRPALAESQARIQSMALIHEHLYRTDDLRDVRLDEYLGQLLDSLHAAHTSAHLPLRLVKNLAPVVLQIKDAIPFGLLVNELLTNAYKHAFRGRATGELRVVLSQVPDKSDGFRFELEDDGVGLPPEEPTGGTVVAPTVVSSLGTQLVRMFSRQLKATLVMEANYPSGTRVVLARE